MKQTTTMLSVLVLVVFTASLAAAQQYQREQEPYQGGPYIEDLPQEKRQALNRITENYYDTMGQLSREMNDKYQQLDQELAREDPDDQQIESLRQEINRLQEQRLSARINFRQNLQEEGISPRYGRMGPGEARGRGQYRGYGPDQDRDRGYRPPRGRDQGYGPGYQGYGPGRDRGYGLRDRDYGTGWDRRYGPRGGRPMGPDGMYGPRNYPGYGYCPDCPYGYGPEGYEYNGQ
ncbi:MAG: periplasmic heavy metal sensor [Desulfovibrionales bacterium]